MSNIVIGWDQGSYTPNAGTRQITLSGLSFTPSVTGLLYVHNYTQKITYFAQAKSYDKSITLTADGDDWIMEYQELSTFPPLGANDVIHIQFDDINNADNPTYVTIPPCVCDENSSTTPLTSGATFTGTATLTNGYGIIYINVYSDVASATDGLVIEQSSDGTNWDFDDTYTIPAATGKTFSVQPAGRYVRVKYTNGGTNQTEFRLQTIMKSNGLDSSHRVQDTLNDDDDGRLRLSVLKLRTAQNDYVSGAATNSGNFKVSLEELESGISTNDNSQLKTTLYGEDGQALFIEQLTSGMPNINTDHALIHMGYGFSFGMLINTLAGSGTKEYCLTAPTDRYIHLKNVNIQVLGSSIQVEIIKDATVTTNTGTLVPINNLNHNSSVTASSEIRENPSYTGGTTVRTVYALADSTNQTTGNANFNENPNQEFVAKNGEEEYIIKVTNLTSNDCIVSIDAFMYEESQGLANYS